MNHASIVGCAERHNTPAGRAETVVPFGTTYGYVVIKALS
jgi:hypothetical protein